MNGIPCPLCGKPTDWVSTYNEWEYACKSCDARFNDKKEQMPPFATMTHIKMKVQR